MSTLGEDGPGGGDAATSAGAASSELVDFYKRYIEAFNARDASAFAQFFHLPVTVVHAPRYDERRAGRALATVTDASRLLGAVPERWARSTIDEVAPLQTLTGFMPRSTLVERDDRRSGIVATVTRWDSDNVPYQQISALYVLTREEGRLGIKVLVELAVADLPTAHG